MDGRKGYSYLYEIRLDNEVIPAYNHTISWNIAGLTPEPKMYLFDFTTNLKLKFIEDGEVRLMGTERFGVWMERGFKEVEFLEADIRFRVRDDYWMPGDQIRSMVRDAVEFARRAEPEFIVEVDLREDETTVHWRIPVKAVVVALDVVTVQQEGESMDCVYQRAISPESLLPMFSVWTEMIPWGNRVKDGLMPHLLLLRNIPRMRVDDEAKLGGSCCVCQRRFILGSPISFLTCRHPVHPRCLFDWVNSKRDDSLCPTCRLPIPIDYEDYDSDSYGFTLYQRWIKGSKVELDRPIDEAAGRLKYMYIEKMLGS